MSGENWHQERDRLLELVTAIERGDMTHIEEGDLRRLQRASPEKLALLKERLAKLNARLDDKG